MGPGSCWPETLLYYQGGWYTARDQGMLCSGVQGRCSFRVGPLGLQWPHKRDWNLPLQPGGHPQGQGLPSCEGPQSPAHIFPDSLKTLLSNFLSYSITHSWRYKASIQDLLWLNLPHDFHLTFFCSSPFPQTCMCLTRHLSPTAGSIFWLTRPLRCLGLHLTGFLKLSR